MDLPTYSDPPQVGSWSPEQIAEAAPLLRMVDVEALAAKNEQTARAFGSVHSWVKAAVKRPEWGVMAFTI